MSALPRSGGHGVTGRSAAASHHLKVRAGEKLSARCSQPGIPGAGWNFVFYVGFTSSSQICINNKAALFTASCLLSYSRLSPAGCQTEEVGQFHLCKEARGAILVILQPL